MARTTTTEILNFLKEMDAKNEARFTSIEARINTLESAKAPTHTHTEKKEKKGKGSAKMVDFVKKDGTVVKCTEAQARVWGNYRDRKSMTVEELKNIKPNITDKGRAYVKSHPSCTQKEASANGCKGITKEGLKALKKELGVR